MSSAREGTPEAVLAGTARYSLHHGDCLDLLRALPDSSVDSLVTDPPGAIAFMNREWDQDKGGRDQWIAWLTGIMREVFRVLKPGAHGLVWAIPRTCGWTQLALEDAGFEIVDKIAHFFGSGFPKAVNVSKAIDEADFRKWLKANPAELALSKACKTRCRKLKEQGKRSLERKLKKRIGEMQRRRAGLLRQVVGSYTASGNAGTPTSEKGGTYGVGVENSDAIELYITRGATQESRRWDGWATALKPGHEDWFLLRKPIPGTIADCVREHGTGAMNIDGCRVSVSVSDAAATERKNQHADFGNGARTNQVYGSEERPRENYDASAGRWPPNVVFTHSAACKLVGERSVKANPTWDTPNRECESGFTGADVSKVRHSTTGRPGGSAMTPGRPVVEESIAVYDCAPDCPVRKLDEQSGESASGGRSGEVKHTGLRDNTFTEETRNPMPPSVGTASRFFPQFHLTELDHPFIYIAKPSRAERDAGLEHFRARTAQDAVGREEDAAGAQTARSGSGNRAGGVVYRCARCGLHLGGGRAVSRCPQGANGEHEPAPAGTGSGVKNVHPTVKSVEQMRYFCRLVTPPGGVVLSPFMGSGTDGVAAICEGFRFLGADLNDTDAEPFVSIARARIEHSLGYSFVPREAARAAAPPKQKNLFEVSG